MVKKNSAEKCELGDRAQQLLKVLIDHYTRDGEPVGSRTLARDGGLDLSPATIRNVMADLEQLGFVVSPHTSSGRVPTNQGYRFFVDSLLTIKPLEHREVNRLGREIDSNLEPKELIGKVSRLLSGITNMAGVVTLPRRVRASVQHVDFLPLSDNRVLGILVFNDREVQNRIIATDRAYSRSELEQAANYLNEQFVGKDQSQVRDALIREMRESQDRMNALMMTAIDMAEQVFQQADNQEDYVLDGQTNLMDCRELGDVEKLRQLFDAFNRKRDILHLLDECVHGQGVHIFIGEESGYQGLDECSVVTAPYKVDDTVVGVLGVIGPTRMAYNRVIPLVDVTARLLGAALKPRD